MVKPSLSRRSLTLAATGMALGLSGCAVDPVTAEPKPDATGNSLLTPWIIIDGGWRADSRQFPPAAAGTGARLRFVQPVAVVARGDVLMVADTGARTLWRVNPTRDAMAPFAALNVMEVGASPQMGNDLNVWIALPSEHVVVQYDASGRVVRRWSDEANAPRPTAVVVPEGRSQVLVGDSAGAQVVVFDPLGRTLRMLGGNNASPLRSIAAMALGPLGLYVLDRLSQQVVVLGPAGEVRELIGDNELVQPRGLAVDRSGRVFVGDDSDQRIRVFRGTQLLATAGGRGAAPGRFGRIESLAVDGNLLYVADSLNMRVQVMMIAPPSMEPSGAGR